MTGSDKPQETLGPDNAVTQLILAEYNRITALERVRLEFMEKVLQTYIAVASVVVGGVFLVAEKGADVGISGTVADALLIGLLALGVITLLRTVNSNVALLELSYRLRALREYFNSEGADLRKYLLVGLIEDSTRMQEWASQKGILLRGASRAGGKGYLAIVTLLNGLCAGAITMSLLNRWLDIELLSLYSLLGGILVLGVVAWLHVFYVSRRYQRAYAQLKSKSLNWFI